MSGSTADHSNGKYHHGGAETRRHREKPLIENQRPNINPKDGENPESTDRKNGHKFFCVKKKRNRLLAVQMSAD
jgi:hypothetical protein